MRRAKKNKFLGFALIIGAFAVGVMSPQAQKFWNETVMGNLRSLTSKFS